MRESRRKTQSVPVKSSPSIGGPRAHRRWGGTTSWISGLRVALGRHSRKGQSFGGVVGCPASWTSQFGGRARTAAWSRRATCTSMSSWARVEVPRKESMAHPPAIRGSRERGEEMGDFMGRHGPPLAEAVRIVGIGTVRIVGHGVVGLRVGTRRLACARGRPRGEAIRAQVALGAGTRASYDREATRLPSGPSARRTSSGSGAPPRRNQARGFRPWRAGGAGPAGRRVGWRGSCAPARR